MRIEAGGPILFDLDGTLVTLGPPADELEKLRDGLLRIAKSARADPSSRSIPGSTTRSSNTAVETQTSQRVHGHFSLPQK